MKVYCKDCKWFIKTKGYFRKYIFRCKWNNEYATNGMIKRDDAHYFKCLQYERNGNCNRCNISTK